MRETDSNVVIHPILGVDIVSATAEAASRMIDGRLAHSDPVSIAFANANLLTMARGDPELTSRLREFIVFNDGIGVDLASIIIHGSGFAANLNGTDFLPFFLRHTTHNARIFILGGRPGVANLSLAKLTKTFPRHQFVGCHHGYFPIEKTADIVAQISASRADVLIVGLGNPSQEFWLAKHLRDTGCKIGFAVGAYIDFSSGRVSRAPKLVRQMRVEWMFRFLLEPRRLFRRYTVGSTSFVYAALRQRLRGNTTVRKASALNQQTPRVQVDRADRTNMPC
jgi:alpha-1,3-mannosyltransferase